MSQCLRGTTASMLLALSLLTPAPTLAATPDDTYLTGYAAAVLAREFHLPAPSLRVREGAITVAEADLTGVDRERVITALSGRRARSGR